MNTHQLYTSIMEVQLPNGLVLIYSLVMEVQLPNGLVLIMHNKGNYNPRISMDTIMSRRVYVDNVLCRELTYDPHIKQLWDHSKSKQCEWIKIKNKYMGIVASLFTSTTPFHVISEPNTDEFDSLVFYAKGRVWEYRPTFEKYLDYRLISHRLMSYHHAVQFANGIPLIVTISQWYVIAHQRRNVFYYQDITTMAGCMMVFPSSVVIELTNVAHEGTCTLVLRNEDSPGLIMCKINLFQRGNDRWYRFNYTDIGDLCMSHYGLRSISTGYYIGMIDTAQPLPVITIF